MIRKKEFVSGIYLLIGDAVAVFIAFHLSFWIRFYSGLIPAPKGIPPFKYYMWFSLLFVLLHLLVFSLIKPYSRQLIWRRSDETLTIFFVNLLVVFLALGIISYLKTYLGLPHEISHLFLATYLAVASVLCPSMRGLVRGILKRKWKWRKTRVAVVGSGRTVNSLLKALERFQPLGIEVLGIFGEFEGEKRLGGERDVIKFAREKKLDEVYILHPLQEVDTMELIRALSEEVLEIKLVPDLMGFVILHHTVEALNGVAAINITHVPLHGWNLILKRFFDILVSLVAIVVFLPAFLIIPLLILLTSGPPVIFKQKRMGLDGREFVIYKFRTMMPGAEDSWAPPEDKITPLGRFLRRWSLDEIPQFFNVLKGDMSIVGPRPERPEYVERFKKMIPKYMLRHKVKSGLTGWAQVHGLRGDTSIEERINYDLYYIENWSLWLDMKIIIMTLWRFPHREKTG